MCIRDRSLQGAAAIFTKLTIGDGLVSQIPALLVAVAAGVLVTRAQRPVDLSREAVSQMSKPIVLVTAAAFLCLLVLTDLPALPLLAIAAGCLAFAWLSNQNGESESKVTESETEKSLPTNEPTMDRLLQNDLIAIELGVDLIPSVSYTHLTLPTTPYV